MFKNIKIFGFFHFFEKKVSPNLLFECNSFYREMITIHYTISVLKHVASTLSVRQIFAFENSEIFTRKNAKRIEKTKEIFLSNFFDKKVMKLFSFLMVLRSSGANIT